MVVERVEHGDFMGIYGNLWDLASGKRLHHYGKSQFLMGQITILTWPFSIAMLNFQRVTQALKMTHL